MMTFCVNLRRIVLSLLLVSGFLGSPVVCAQSGIIDSDVPGDAAWCPSTGGCYPSYTEAEIAMRAAIPDVGQLLVVDYQELGNLKPQIFYRVPDQPPASYGAPWYGGRDYSWNFAGECPNSQVPVTYNDYGEELCYDETEMIANLIENIRDLNCDSSGQNCRVGNFRVVGEYDTPYNVLYGSRFSSYNSKRLEYDEYSGGYTYSRIFQLFREQPFTCPAGMSPVGRTSDTSFYPNVCRSSTRPSISKVAFRQVRTCPVNANPCHPATGDKSRAEADFIFAGRTFTRFYHSMREVSFNESSLAPGWTHSFAARLYPYSGMMLSSDGYKYDIRWLDGGSAIVVPGLGNAHIRHDAASGEWYLDSTDGDIWRFNSGGLLLAMTNSRDPARDVQFVHQQMPATRFASSRNLLVQAIDSAGRVLQFHYDEYYRLAGVTLPDEQLLIYGYDGQGNLATVDYGGGQVKQYHYGEPELAPNGDHGLLTGITSEDGRRYASFGYDAYGRVKSSVLHGTNGPVDTTFIHYTAANVAEVETAAGGVRRYVYSSSPDRSPLSVTDAGGVTVNTYDGYGRLVSHTDANGVRKEYSFTIGHPTQTIEAANDTQGRKRTVQTDWHTTLNVPVERRTLDATNTLIGKITWTYNPRGQVLTTTQTDPASGAARIAANTYCEQSGVDTGICPRVGLLLSVDGPRTDVADITTYTYYPADDPACATEPTTCPHRKGDLWKVTNALGHVTETLAYDGAGRPLSVKDTNGVITDFRYDARGHLTQRKLRGGSGADARITRITYWPTGLVKKITQPDGSTITYHYDAAQRLVTIRDSAGNRIHYTLDNAGNRIREDTRDPTGALTRRLTRLYNTLGQLQSQSDADGHATGYSYDASGNPISVIDPLGHQTANAYDPLGRLVVTAQDATGLAAQTQFAYDAQDNLTQVTDPNGLHTDYGYNGLGDLTQLTSPDTGITQYAYDSAGNRLVQTDARGKTQTYSYDALNRLTQISSPNRKYLYDSANSSVCPTGERANKGRLSGINDPSGTTRYCHNRFGDLTRKVQTTNGITFTTLYGYDSAGRLVTTTYPDGATVDVTYDSNGQVSTLGVTPNGGTRQPLLTGITYAPFGPASGWEYGNGRILLRNFNRNYQPEAINDTDTGGLSLGYGFDAAGNLTQLHDAAQTTMLAQYGYDALNRLTQVMDGPTGTPIETYAYDATGNRISLTTASGTTAYTYPLDSHRLTGVGTITRAYDAAGNTTKIGGSARQFSYDASGRMTQVKANGIVTRQYQYNARGEQVRSYLDADNTYFTYDEAGHLLGEYDGNGNPKQQIIWLGDMPVGVLQGAGTNQALHYIEPDHLGTPRVVIDGSRNVAIWNWPLIGEAFGATVPDEDPDHDGARFVLDMRFPGQRYDAATGLNYNYFRDYDPATGRYVESDPIGLGGGLSTYVFVSGNPFVALDPLGLSDDSSPWSVGWEWLTGIGPRHHQFVDGDSFAETLRRHGNIQRLLKAACEGSIPNKGQWDYSVAGWKGVPLYLHDYSNLLTAGHTGNIAVAFLGSYDVDYSIQGSTLLVHVYNSSSIESATHPPVIGYTDWWSRNIGARLNQWRNTGPMSEVTQDFNLTFDLSKCRCK